MTSGNKTTGAKQPMTPNVNKKQMTKNRKMTSAATNIWRLAHFFMFIFFSLATCVQLNDEDSCTWLVIYGIPTILTFALVVNPKLSAHGVWVVVNFIHTSCCTCFLIYLLVMLLRAMNIDDGSQEPSWNVLQYEEGREVVGVILVISWLKLARATTNRVFAEPSKSEGYRLSAWWLFVLFMLPVVPLSAWAICFVDGLNKKLGHCSGMFSQCDKPTRI